MGIAGRVVAVLLPVALGVAAGASGGEPRTLRGALPALALDVAGPAGPAETFAAAPGLVEALRTTALEETVRLADWPVAPGDRRTVELARHDVYADGARIVAIGKDGEVEVPRSTLLFFWGTAVGDPSRRVLVSLDPDRGTIGGLGAGPDGVFEVRPGAGAGEYRIASTLEAPRAAGETGGFTCGDSPVSPDEPARPPADPGGAATSVLSSLHTATIAVDTDNELMALKFLDNSASATNYLASCSR
jgi:hypothetical protein